MWRSEPELVSKPCTTYCQKDDFAGTYSWHVFRMDPQRIIQQALYWQVGTRIQERTRSTKSELEEYSQQRPANDGVHLEGSRGGSSWQTRVTSECGPICLVGCGMNQGQGLPRPTPQYPKDFKKSVHNFWSAKVHDRTLSGITRSYGSVRVL